MAGLADRFEAKVDRSGDHHLWTGAKKADGTGLLKVDGRMATAARVAWELAHGRLGEGQTVSPCPDVRACVRLEHLSSTGPASTRAGRSRARGSRGAGTKVELRPGVWKITVSAGRYEDGKVRREHRIVHGMTEDEATREQLAFAAEVRASRQAKTQGDRDMTLDQAVELYLQELGEDKGRERRTLSSYKGVHEKWRPIQRATTISSNSCGPHSSPPPHVPGPTPSTTGPNPDHVACTLVARRRPSRNPT